MSAYERKWLMYNIPYGVVNSLLSDGWIVKPNRVNGHEALHMPNENWFIVDHGENYKTLTIMGGTEGIRFGENCQPLKIIIGKTTTVNGKAFSYKNRKSLDLLIKMFRYYGARFEIEDNRPAALRKEAEKMRERAQEAVLQSAKYQEKAEALQLEAIKLEKMASEYWED